MMKPNAPRIRMPSTAKIGDIIQIKTKIRHPMETGWRKGGDGQTVPRDRITRFTCTFEGKEVVSADYDSGIASDPYLMFHAKVTGTGVYTFKWEADGEKIMTTSVPLTITNA
ncbi:MAG: thiosulfate oxidation carrier complex protein SoxZ [Rhodospirillales bacterium]|nr:thiosulfate oxidation carrier complex protein SoxZ [Rhodospirillales bacterium]